MLLPFESYIVYGVTMSQFPIEAGAAGTLETAEKVYRAGGMLEMTRAEHDALPAGQCMWPYPPLPARPSRPGGRSLGGAL